MKRYLKCVVDKAVMIDGDVFAIKGKMYPITNEDYFSIEIVSEVGAHIFEKNDEDGNAYWNWFDIVTEEEDVI